MGNVKVVPPDAFLINCKMMCNDLSQMRDRVKRMWAAGESVDDYLMLETIEEMLEVIEKKLQDRLDK